MHCFRDCMCLCPRVEGAVEAPAHLGPNNRFSGSKTEWC